MQHAFAIAVLIFLCVSGSIATGEIAPGLDHQEMTLATSTHGDSKLQVVKIDPAMYEPHILTVSGGDAPKSQSAREWAKLSGAALATNAGMYLKDYKTAVSHLKADGHINQPRVTGDKMMFAFGPGNPPQLLDRDCDDFLQAQKTFRNLLQGIRMYSCKGKNVWSQQKKKWSQVAIATDKQGKILILFARSPYTTHDFINQVAALPLAIDRMMYLEGGPPAQLYLNTKSVERGWLGSYSTGTNESDDNVLALPFPNALVFKRK